MYHPNVFTRCFLSLPLTLPVFPHMSHFPFVLHTPPRHFPFLVQAASRALGDFYQLICRFRTLTAPTATRPPPRAGTPLRGGSEAPLLPTGGTLLSRRRSALTAGVRERSIPPRGGVGATPPPTSRHCVCRAPSSSPAESGSKRERAVCGVPTRSTRAPLGGGDPRDPLSLDPARGGGRGGAPTPREPRPCLLPPPQVKCTLSWFV